MFFIMKIENQEYKKFWVAKTATKNKIPYYQIKFISCKLLHKSNNMTIFYNVGTNLYFN